MGKLASVISGTAPIAAPVGSFDVPHDGRYVLRVLFVAALCQVDVVTRQGPALSFRVGARPFGFGTAGGSMVSVSGSVYAAVSPGGATAYAEVFMHLKQGSQVRASAPFTVGYAGNPQPGEGEGLLCPAAMVV